MAESIIKEMFEEFYTNALPKNNMLSKEALEALFYATLAFNTSFMRKKIGKDLTKGMFIMSTVEKELHEHIEEKINEHKRTRQN